MTKELCLKALDQAYLLQKPKGNVLHHSDRGSQYASLDDQQRLCRYGMTSSMSREGNGYENACIESFHSVLKKLIYLHKFKTRKEAREKIFEYITCFYNGKRIHSAIGYFTPNQYERTFSQPGYFSRFYVSNLLTEVQGYLVPNEPIIYLKIHMTHVNPYKDFSISFVHTSIL